jgi:hypothetical protein
MTSNLIGDILMLGSAIDTVEMEMVDNKLNGNSGQNTVEMLAASILGQPEIAKSR